MMLPQIATIEHWVGGAAFYGIAAYALQTVPTPKNAWARWLIGVLQFALANKEKGLAAMAPTEKGDQ